MKKVWIESPACTGRMQCHGCRCDAGFQAKLPTFFVMPRGWPVCPFGITAETIPEVSTDTPPGNAILAARRREICQGCGWTCRLSGRSGCYVKRFLNTPWSTCPEGHWAADTTERIDA